MMLKFKKAVFLALLTIVGVSFAAENDSNPESFNTPPVTTKLSIAPIKPMTAYPSRKMSLLVDNKSGYFVSSIFQGCSNWARGSGWLLSSLAFKKMLPGEKRRMEMVVNESEEYKCAPGAVQVINVYCQVDRAGLTLELSSPWFAAQSVKIHNSPVQEITVTNSMCRALKDAPAL